MNTAWLLLTQVISSNIVQVNSFAILAQAAEVVLNKNEFNSLLLGQLIQIIAVLASIGVSFKALRRNPPMSEEVVALSMRVQALEERATRLETSAHNDMAAIEKRLADGDTLFRNELAAIEGVKATVGAVQQDVHFIKQQISTLLSRK